MGLEPNLAQKAGAEVSALLLPVYLDDQPEKVLHFAREGFATVLRLPLLGDTAAAAAIREIDRLLDEQAPVLIFLRRLARLRISQPRSGRSDVTLTRLEQPEAVKPDAPNTALLWTTLDARQRFLVAAMRIDKDAVLAAVRASIKAGFPLDDWLEWHGDPEIAIALCDSEKPPAGRFYNFLPMAADARSPCIGHVNAPFFAQIDRRSFDQRVPLNSFLLDQVARLAAEVCIYLAGRTDPLPDRFSIDCLAWGKDSAPRLVKAFATLEQRINNSKIVPVLGRGKRQWSSLGEYCVWPAAAFEWLTETTVAEITGAPVLPRHLGTERLQAVHALRLCTCYSTPDLAPHQIAALLETAAAHLHRQKAKPLAWMRLYSDATTLLTAQNLATLGGKRIVLSAEGTLCAAGQVGGSERQIKVFVHPGEDRERLKDSSLSDGLVQPPKRIRRKLAFTDPALRWPKPIKEAFLHAGLIHEFQIDVILDELSHLVSGTPHAGFAREVLEWVYRLWMRDRKRVSAALAESTLKVPTKGGWRLARDSYLSGTWGSRTARWLEEVAQEGATVSVDWQSIRDSLVVSPSEVFAGSTRRSRDELRHFMQDLGVSDGLRVFATPIRMSLGWMFSRDRILRFLQRPEHADTYWSQELAAASYSVENPNTSYRLGDGHAFWRLPGQEVYGQLNDSARLGFASLIGNLLQRSPEVLFTAEIGRFDRKSSEQNRTSVPTPLIGFLKRAAWIPVSRPGEQMDIKFVAASEAWSATEVDDLPRFIPRIHKLVLPDGLLPTTSPFWTNSLGTKDWSSQSSALARIRVLADSLPQIDETHFDMLRQQYSRAWEALMVAETVALGSLPFQLIVSRAGRLARVEFGKSSTSLQADEVIYLADSLGTLAYEVLAHSDTAVFDATVKYAKQAADWLRRMLGHAHANRLRLVSSVRPEISIDGVPFEPTAALEPLIAFGREWIGELCVLAVELREGPTNRNTPKARSELLQAIRRVRLHFAGAAALCIDGQEKPIPTSFRDVLPVPHPNHPTLLVMDGSTSLTLTNLPQLQSGLAMLIGRPSLAQPFEIAFSRLQRSMPHQQALDPPDPTILAQALGVTLPHVKEILRACRASLEALIRQLIPVVHYFCGRQAAEILSRMRVDLGSEEDLVTFLRSLEEPPPYSPEELVRACSEAVDLRDLRIVLHLDLSRFNRTLRDLGEPYQPIHNAPQLQQAFKAFKESTEQRNKILDRLRTQHFEDFLTGRSLDNYAKRRDLRFIEFNEAWLDEYEELSDEVIANWINRKLELTLGAPRLVSARLLPLDEVRRQNKSKIDKFAERFQLLVPAFAAKRGMRTPQPWSGDDPSRPISSILHKALDDAGALDFALLDDSTIAARLANLNMWPANMPATTDSFTIGVSDADIAEERRKSEKQRAARDLASRQIVVDGDALDAGDPEFIAAIQGRLDLAVEKNSALSLRSKVDLAIVTRPPDRRRTERVASRAAHKMTEQQKDAIGKIGEMIAYRWLQKNFARQFSDSCWVSSIGRGIIGSGPGDDNRGYDFEVPLRSFTWQFEVKASSGDPLGFELGQSEIAAAVRAASDSIVRYRILYVPNATTLLQAQVLELPNPFTPDARKLYLEIGSGGIHLKFAVVN